ncbi:MAG: hypothetical protein U5R30_17790 [Deltaproteobacteria bacterium]|nr:hypothetical protein [Deltaproteobacteria bacterium]
MNEKLSVEELERRWQNVLLDTAKAVSAHPQVHREIKRLAADIIAKPLDIADYAATAERLVRLLKTISSPARGSIFQFYVDRVSPSSICNLKFLRVECHDLLSHLAAFDEWRHERRHLRILK